MPVRSRPGQALVEFALVLPLLLSLLTGIVDVGFLYNHQLILTNAAREGARLGALGQSSTAVRTAITDYLTSSAYSPLPPSSGVLIDLTNGQASVTIQSTVPFLFAMSGPPIALQAVTKMRLE